MVFNALFKMVMVILVGGRSKRNQLTFQTLAELAVVLGYRG